MAQSPKAEIECKYCGKDIKRQGLFAHVRNSGDDKHGPSGDVPEDFDLNTELERQEGGEDVGSVEGQEIQNTIWMCDLCGKMCKGRRGLQIHYSTTEGDGLHPDRISVDDEQFVKIPANSDWEPVTDDEELTQLHGEIMANIHSLSLYEGTDIEQKQEEELSPEIRELLDTVIIPQSATKPEQVAAVLEQVPELYNKPETVKDLVSCSTTSFYKGRKRYDGEAEDEVESEIEHREHSVIIDGQKFVPASRVKELVKEMNEISNQLNKASTEGAKMVHRSR